MPRISNICVQVGCFREPVCSNETHNFWEQNRPPRIINGRISEPCNLMSSYRRFSLFASFSGALLLILTALPSSHAATLWTGPNITWTKSVTTPSDAIIPGSTVLTRGSRDVLINTAAGETFAGALSPKNCGFGFGTLANFSTIHYQSMESFRATANFNLANVILNRPMVLHLTNEDIYISITFTTWGRFGSGTVSYTRSTSGAVPPTVNITSPAGGAIFADPANVNIAATATVSGGTVTNVTFLDQSSTLGSDQTSPFSIVASNLAVGAHALRAVATAGGLSGTSSIVNITVVSPVDIDVGPPSVAGGTFSFDYAANPGLRYVVEVSSNLPIWIPVITNTAGSSTVIFSEPFNPDPIRVFRVGRLPNP
jgi:hypothetical protein